MLTKGQRIKLAIERAGMKQTAVATFCGVTDQAVSNWIRESKISSDQLARVAGLTKTRMEWLETGKGPVEDIGAIEEALVLGKGLPASAVSALESKDRIRLAHLIEYLRDGRLSAADFEFVWQMIEHLVDRKPAKE